MPAPTTQTQFLADTQTKIKQYLYRGLEQSFDPTVEFIQLISQIGPINWANPTNNIRIQRVFTNLAASIGAYTVLSGDFRTYLLLSFVDILYTEFNAELFSEYVQSSYNVIPTTVVGSLDSTPDLAPPQNTNFPGLSNTSSVIDPIKRKMMIPSSIYDDMDSGFTGFPNAGTSPVNYTPPSAMTPQQTLVDTWDTGNGDCEGMLNNPPPTKDGSGII